MGRKDNTIAAIAIPLPLEVLRAHTPIGKLTTPTNDEIKKQPIPIVEIISLLPLTLLVTAKSKIKNKVPNTKNSVEIIPNTNDVTAKPLLSFTTFVELVTVVIFKCPPYNSIIKQKDNPHLLFTFHFIQNLIT